MGAWSPIAAQARRGAKPDSVVLMVGGCASGLPATSRADLLCSFTPLDRCREMPAVIEGIALHVMCQQRVHISLTMQC